jgi:hypothetical protein
MANESYVNGSVSVGTTATLVCTVAAENDDVLVSCSAATVFGGPNVTATTGVSIAANTPTHIPSTGGYVHDLYAVVGTGTSTVTFLYPSV